MSRFSFILAGVVGLSLLAGCLEAEDDSLSRARGSDLLILPAAGPLPLGFEFVCPPGETTVRSDGLCVGTIDSLTESNQEPYVAIDPNRPEVIAVGVNAGHTTGAVDPMRPAPGIDVILLDIFFSEDGGESWRLSQIPYVPTPHSTASLDGAAASGDPALAFDENGVLHVSGIATQDVAQRGWDVFYTSTADLGRTWSTPLVFTADGANDRNWLNVAPGGRILVPWQFFGATNDEGGSRIAWSEDGGVTWRVQEIGQHAKGCFTVSVVAFLDDEPYIACGHRDDGGELTGVRVFHFDEDSGDLHLRAEVSALEAIWPQLATPGDGTLVLTGEESGTVKITMSLDAGLTWTDPRDIRETLTVEDGWNSVGSFWVTGDPWGSLELILAGSETLPLLPVPAAGPTSSAFRVAHVVLDPLTLEVLSERIVSTSDGMEESRVPPSLAPPWGDHYYGIAFGDASAFLVWTRDKGLDYATVEPVFAV